jgi:hypothetical protein
VAEIDAEIEVLGSSVVHAPSAEVLAAIILPFDQLNDLQKAPVFGWRFDWSAVVARPPREVFSLLAGGSETVQGLIALKDAGDHVFVELIESAPHNIGENKLFHGVPGNLFAFACARSVMLGHQGFVSFVAKSELVEHYRQALGAYQVGTSNRMIVDGEASARLVEKHHQEQDQWPSM